MDGGSTQSLESLGLGGDGDEIAAIAEIERQFGVCLDYSGAGNWHTAGDVFTALRHKLPSDTRDDVEVWRKFAEAISSETGANPGKVAPSTLLLAKPLSHRRFWLAVIVGLAAAAYIALT